MKENKILVFLRRMVFLVVLASILIHMNAVFERKKIYGDWNYSIKVGGLANEPENSFDIMGFGSSHMYCTLNPVYLYEQTGLRSYVFATQQQPVVATYYYVKEAFKTQNPDVIVVEALMFARGNDKVAEGVAHDAIDFFPNSSDKVQMIMDMDQEDGKENYFFNFLKYHSRWKELDKSDFDFAYRDETDPYHGYVFLSKVTENNLTAITYDQVNRVEIDPEHLRILLEIKKLAEENQAEMLLLFAPSSINSSLMGSFKVLHEFAEQNGIDTLDQNIAFDELMIDNATDFYDSGHLNVYGAEKASIHIGRYILENYEISSRNIDDKHLWDEDIEIYNNRKASLLPQ